MSHEQRTCDGENYKIKRDSIGGQSNEGWPMTMEHFPVTDWPDGSLGEEGEGQIMRAGQVFKLDIQKDTKINVGIHSETHVV